MPGADAVALGARLAAASGSDARRRRRAARRRPQRDHPAGRGLRPLSAASRPTTWLRGRRPQHPGCRRRTATHVRFADSFAEGLVAAADEFGASHIVVGAANGGLRGRHRLGTVATELLHSSNVPGRARARGLASDRPGDRRHAHHRGDRHPAGRRRAARGGDVARRGHRRRAAPALARHGRSAGERRHRRHPHRRRRPRRRGARAGARRTAGRQSTPRSIVGRGDSIEDAVSHLSWEPGETRDRRLEPPRPAAPALPRLDRCEDAARTARSHDRGAAHARRTEGESR